MVPRGRVRLMMWPVVRMLLTWNRRLSVLRAKWASLSSNFPCRVLLRVDAFRLRTRVSILLTWAREPDRSCLRLLAACRP